LPSHERVGIELDLNSFKGGIQFLLTIDFGHTQHLDGQSIALDDLGIARRYQADKRRCDLPCAENADPDFLNLSLTSNLHAVHSSRLQIPDYVADLIGVEQECIMSVG
jgi:hypothetical protein